MLHCVNLKRHVALLIIKLLHKVNQGYTAKTNEIMSRVLFLKSTDYCTVNFCSPWIVCTHFPRPLVSYSSAFVLRLYFFEM